MNASDLKAWQSQIGLSATAAAIALDVRRSTYHNWLSGHPIKGHIDLACAALAAGLKPFSACASQNAPLHSAPDEQ